MSGSKRYKLLHAQDLPISHQGPKELHTDSHAVCVFVCLYLYACMSMYVRLFMSKYVRLSI